MPALTAVIPLSLSVSIKLRKLLKNGKIGKIKQVSCFYVYGLLTTGTHVIDTLRMLLNDVAGEIVNVVGIKNSSKDFTPKDDKNYDAWFRYASSLNVIKKYKDASVAAQKCIELKKKFFQ